MALKNFFKKKSVNKSDKDSNLKSTNCSYCNKPFNEELWCKKCDPLRIIEGWTSGNSDIDKFIKDTMYARKARKGGRYEEFLEWVPFGRFTDIKQISEGGFSKVYSAIWLDGLIQGWNFEQKRWKRLGKTKVALKVLEDSQNISSEFLEEVN